MDLTIEEFVDKNMYFKKLTNDNVINITGEGGSGKSTIANEYRNNDEYIVVDYDLIMLNPEVGSIEYELKQMLINKYGNDLFENAQKIGMNNVKTNFTTIYNEIIDYLSNRGKTIVLDGSQLRFISDVKNIKGDFIALRPSLQTCIKQSTNRFIENNPNATEQEINDYVQKRSNILHKLNPMMNELIDQVDKISNLNNNQSINIQEIEKYLTEQSIKYLGMIDTEYGEFMSEQQKVFLQQLLSTKCVRVEQNGQQYLQNQQQEIIKNNNLTQFQKIEELRSLTIPLAHGGRVFEDNIIHFYPSILLSQNPNLSTKELEQKCDEILMHELLHFFIRPEKMNVSNNAYLRKINSFTTEGLVDMCARDIQMKYNLFLNYSSEYGSNVIFMREALSHISSTTERMKLIFNGSIEQIYRDTTTLNYDSIKNFIASRDKKSDFDKLISKLSFMCYSDAKANKSFERILYNYSANFDNKTVSLSEIKKQIEKQIPEKANSVKKQIDLYIKAQKSFDYRTPEEIQTANKIKEKNKQIREEKHNQALDKPKVLVKTNSNMSGNGFVSAFILSLLTGFAAGVIFMIVYMVIK